MRTYEDTAPLFGDAGGSRIGFGDVEVIDPSRHGHRVDLVHHATDRCMAGDEELIGAHRTDVDGIRLGPAELPGVEVESFLPVHRMEFMPADMARCSGGCGRAVASQRR